MKVRIINKSGFNLPTYATPQSAGIDLKACIVGPIPSGIGYIQTGDTITLLPGGRCLIPTGLFMALPAGYEAQVRPRSGLAIKKGITVLNSPGTIDADYRGEVGIILINHGKEAFAIKHGDRIAQMVVAKYEQVEFDTVDSLDDTERGTGGFGSTKV